jgi:integrase
MSIRKRTWLHKGEQKSAWVVDYSDLGGKRRLKTFRTQAKAKAYAASTHVDLARGIHVADGASVTVAQAAELWLATNADDGLEPASIARNRSHVNNHIAPRIGTVRLNQLTVPAVRAFADRLRAEGVSKALARMIVVSLGGILADAQERGLAMTNPVRERRRQRGKRGASEDEREAPLAVGVDIPSPAEIRSLLQNARNRRRAILAVLAFCGLRSSELRGLRWQDVDLERATLTVWQRADPKGKLGRLKSKKGYRTLPLLPLAVNALREWKMACPKGKLGLVFPDAAGDVGTHHAILRDEWWPLQADAGLTAPASRKDGSLVRDKDGEPVIGPKYSGLHVLRHFFASWCAARREDGGLGLPLKTTSERCGHATVAITADTYGHLFPASDDAELLAAAERSLLGA